MSKYIKNANLGKIIEINNVNVNSATILGTSSIIIDKLQGNQGQIVGIYKDKLIITNVNKVIYEPEIKDKLCVEQSEKMLCLYEKTCGAVIYTVINGKFHFLLIKNESGHIGFPKGHIELNETEEETALREVFEETGIKIILDKEFKMEYDYTTLENTYKKCVYFLAQYEYSPAKIQESEISQSWLVPFDEAMTLLNFVQDREILTEVKKRLEK